MFETCLCGTPWRVVPSYDIQFLNSTEPPDQSKTGLWDLNQSIPNITGLRGDLIANKGSGVTYIIENTALLGWFKTGIVSSEENFKTRMQSYKSIIPIGEWNVVYFEHTEDSAKEELKIKQFFRFECEYEMGINSNEWFKGDWKVINKIDTLKNIIDYTPQRVCQQKYAK